jgi:hypothetical protein
MAPSDTDKDNLYNTLKTKSDALISNNNSTERQYEINEWTSNNKLDTLFFYQLLLITLTLMAPLLYLQKNGIIPSTAFYGITGILAIAVVLTLIVRAQYTYGTRDLRYWNRRRFASMGGPPTATTCDAIIAASKDQAKMFQKKAMDIGGDLE